MKVALTIVQGPQKGLIKEFTEPRGFIIGRASDADYILPHDDPYVSRRHLYVEICPPSCRVQNLSSTNVAHLNGVPITTPCELVHGDVLELGYTRFQVAIGADIAETIGRCRQCAQPVHLIAGDDEPDGCEACSGTRQAAQAPLTVRCRCGADLTDRANSDGRARELDGIVEYVCEAHLPQQDGARLCVGPYQTCRPLGEGAFGAVHLAYHAPTSRLVALKQLKELTNGELVKRFQREMRVLERLAHPNVVRYVGTGIDERGAPYLATEYLASGSLQGLVDRNGGRLPFGQAVDLILTALSGLAYIHSEHVIHRDIKPDNILLWAPPSGQQDPLSVKLADFGLAVSYARAGGTRLTRLGMGMGTLMYMSPEQVKNTAGVRETADVYSMGVTLYYLLTGHYTFNFPTPAEIAAFAAKARGVWKKPQDILPLLMERQRIEHPIVIILKDNPISILDRDRSVPEQLAQVVDRAVQKEPTARFQSAGEFQAALREAASSIGLAAPPRGQV